MFLAVIFSRLWGSSAGLLSTALVFFIHCCLSLLPFHQVTAVSVLTMLFWKPCQDALSLCCFLPTQALFCSGPQSRQAKFFAVFVFFVCPAPRYRRNWKISRLRHRSGGRPGFIEAFTGRHYFKKFFPMSLTVCYSSPKIALQL